MNVIAIEPDVLGCAACGVEYGTDRRALPTLCPICSDERQYIPPTGQAWVTQAELAERSEVRIAQLGSDQWGITAVGVGISQTMQVVRTRTGVLVWDPTGLADVATAEFIRSLGPVTAIVASHPHMYGAQVSWSRALDDAPVLVHSNDEQWLQRRSAVIEPWSGDRPLGDDLELRTLGGHFPGSAIAYWSAGAAGAGVVLAGDTIMVNSDRKTVGYMRSYPNHIPLSGPVVKRIGERMSRLRYEQLWSNFGKGITEDAADKVQASAKRHIAWTSGDYDHLT